MKHQKTKFLTLTLASVLGAVALGGGVVSAVADDAATATPKPATYSTSDVFTTSAASFDASGDILAFTVQENKEGSVTLSQRDLAWKWYTEKGKVSYLNFKLSFADTNFETLTVNLETAVATANEDGKAVNKLVFTKGEGNKVYASVNDSTTKTEVNVASNNVLTVSVNQTATEYGEYNVVINDGAEKAIGKFENVGAAYGEYASSTASTPLTPFKITVKIPEYQEESITQTKFYLHELNGQSFALTESKIVDNAKPVLVVNEELSAMMFGTAFALDYDYVDVLDKTLQKTVKFAQYKPGVEGDKITYKDLTTSTYFTETPYTKDDGTKTNVYAENGREFVSIKITLSDEFYKDATKVEYDLSWYANAASVVELGDTVKTDYIVLDRNTEGATYTFLSTENGENKITNQAAIDTYQGLVEKEAEGLKAGSKTNFYLPSMIGLINDNGGYTNLKFTISYRSTNSGSPSTRSSLSASSLQFPVSKSGTYQFKVFAVDKTDNGMMYYNADGELVKVTTSNVWDIEEIPYFQFEVPETSLSIEDNDTSASDSKRKDKVGVDEKYDDFDLNVLGDSSSTAKKETKLYLFDADELKKAFPAVKFSQSKLSSIMFKEIDEAVTKEAYAAADDYVDLYLDAYLSILAKNLSISKDALVQSKKKIFREIQPFNDKITEEAHSEEYAKNNVYKWDAESQTFVAADEDDVYFMLAVYTDEKISSLKTCGYKVITVEAESDVLPGEDDWLKNNLVSVILFGVAGLMLILIIVVLLIKPSDEKLEDVEAKEKSKKAKKAKKEKDAKDEE